MDASVSFDTSAIVLTAEDAWFSQSSLRDAAWWARDRGLLVQEHSGTACVLTIPLDEWSALGRGPTADDAESIETWRFGHEAIAKLFGLGEETLAVHAIGYVGGAKLRTGVTVNGDALELNRSTTPRFENTVGQPVLLSPLASAVVQELVTFSASEHHTRAEQLALIAELKRLRSLQQKLGGAASRLRIHLDKHLDSFEIVEPERFAVRWTDAGRNRVSLKLFVQGETEPLPLENLDEHAPIIQRSSRETVALDPGTAVVARRARDLQEVRREKVGDDILRNPLSLIPEGVETPRLDFSQYSHRVVGFEPAVVERATFGNTSGTSWYTKDDDGQGRIFLTAVSPAGQSVELAFETGVDAAAAASSVEQAIEHGRTQLEVQGQSIQASPELSRRLREVIRLHNATADTPMETERASETSDGDTPKEKARRMRAILEDLPASDTLDESAPSNLDAAVPWELLQRVLGSHVALKPHQRVGIAWLWHRYKSGASGAVLADDMGLGKTLQIACFVALIKLTRASERPKRPTLIIAPVMLISNWCHELTAFFQGPFPGRLIELRDERLRGMRLATGELDRVQLETFDVVIASYETLAKYAMSLLGIDWDVVVLDEAHRIKNRGTQWSVAARGLSGRADQVRPRKFEFGICATGTPVENSISDIWALYDFASPGSPFGAYESFRDTYERVEDAPRQLSQRLQIGSLASSLLRRDKAAVLTGFPPKMYRSIPVAMTAAQRDLERTLTHSSAVKTGGSFKILEALQKLYQHPWLLKSENEISPSSDEDAITASPKLAECIKLLEQIQSIGEKALVFTLWTRMQWLLKEVIEHRLGLKDIPILNGDPKNRKRAHEHIEAFSKAPGFAVMILSPLAAGVGLNITAANHVIHYGRWWNPAKEDQATDRVYRIGQSRPVHVYYPVLHHPGDPTEGFDVKLDELVSRKRATARELLEPAGEGDLSAEDLQEIGLEGS